MAPELKIFLHFVFIGFIALFPVVNPIGSALILNPYFSHLGRMQRKKYVRKVAGYAFIVSVITLLAGRWILELFGITVPIIQLAGGIMIAKIGWEFLTVDSPASDTAVQSKDVAIDKDIESKLFYPITFPMTTGAGTIAVLFTLSAHSASSVFSTSYLLTTGALIVSVIGICLLIYIFFVNATSVINYIGSHNEKIINRVMAFLIFCVGLQIAVEGVRNLIK